MVMNILRSRKFAKKVLFGILILIIPAFVLWGVGSLGKGPKPIGKIGSQKIYPRDLIESLQGVKIQLLFSYYGDFDTLNKIMQNVSLVNQMAFERLVLLNAAQKNRIKISDDEVRSYISFQPIFQRNGIFNDEVYNYILRNTLSLQPRSFEELIRQNLKVMVFRNNLLKDVVVTDAELLRFYKMLNDKVKISYLLVDKELFEQDAVIAPQKVRESYESNKEKFLTPAKIDIEYIEISYENVKERDEAIDALKKVYPSLQKSPETLSQAAEENGFKHGTTGPFYREELIPGIKFSKKVHEVAFNLKKGEVSIPVIPSSEKGEIYILRKIEDYPPRALSFDEVKDFIYSTLKEQEKLKLAAKKGDEIYGKIVAKNTTLNKAAKELGRQVESTDFLTSNSYIENIGPAKTIVTMALETEPGNITSPIQTAKGTLIVETEKIIPADEAKFEENKKNLRKALLNQKQISVLDKWFNDQRSIQGTY